ncbi:peptidase M17 [Actinoplanes sp. SE50]|uniref:leucyl aminopeptidase family protein n=1 Tax=unclassified Actinoplanes TaxID=2626549 RepID=UPI00023EDE66|nr:MULTISPECIES: leucyl aminopeptidase family protein [unclassified Actinoplanes]AEV88723.1 leucyl aminopeptidase [Actinoplanes sp. SE50/110]ATO87127.1 peptidase M17 [Actinoplanes sp. SE50]SLM04545.1 peptidase M17 [Actinoplanes sp. SE50/110]
MFAIGFTEAFDQERTWVVPAGHVPPGEVGDEIAALAGVLPDEIVVLPRPLRRPARVLLAGVGDGDEAGWRAAGAGIVRALGDDEPVQILLPDNLPAAALRGLAEGLWLGGYRYRDGVKAPRSGAVDLVVQKPTAAYAAALAQASATATATWLARDLTNTPASTKNPEWFADQIVALADGRPGLSVTVRAGDDLARFGGLLAVGGGSVSPPRFVELSWAPEGATTHVVLVGKGITFDTGGISIKPRDGMKLMKKDMGGAAAVLAATLGAAELNLPVRVTALAPLAENAVSGSAFRPGDVITHYDGSTTENTNSDAEGRIVLADALSYAADRLDPDLVLNLATLTGANAVALGKRTAALYSPDDDLAAALTAAGEAAGERMWRLPLAGEYTENLRSDIADRISAPSGPGSVMAALFLRDFFPRVPWAHLDMSAPSWAEAHDGELTKGATGWGARTLLRYLSALDGGQ